MPRVFTNSVEIEYEVTGEGEPLVLIAGIGAQLVMWPEELCEQLVGAGFQVIRLDNRDVGLSSRVDAPIGAVPPLMVRGFLGLPVAAPYTLSDMALDVVGLLDELGIAGAHVVGSSLGGMIAQTLTIDHPGRVRSLTSIMSTTGRRRDGVGTPRALRALAGGPVTTVDEAIADAVQFYEVCGSRGFAMKWDRIRDSAALGFERSPDRSGSGRQLAAMIASGSRYEALRRVRAPTAVIHGSVDPLILPRGGRATAKAVPDSSLRVIEGMGHHFPDEVFPIFVEEIRRVADRSAG